MLPNFIWLDISNPEIASLITAMLQARELSSIARYEPSTWVVQKLNYPQSLTEVPCRNMIVAAVASVQFPSGGQKGATHAPHIRDISFPRLRACASGGD